MSKRLYEIHSYGSDQDHLSTSSGSRSCVLRGTLKLQEPLSQENYDKYMAKPYKHIFKNEEGREALKVGSSTIEWPDDDPNHNFEEGGVGFDSFETPLLDFLADLEEDYTVSGKVEVEDDFGGILTFDVNSHTTSFVFDGQVRKNETFDDMYADRASLLAKITGSSDIPEMIDTSDMDASMSDEKECE